MNSAPSMLKSITRIHGTPMGLRKTHQYPLSTHLASHMHSCAHKCANCAITGSETMGTENHLGHRPPRPSSSEYLEQPPGARNMPPNRRTYPPGPKKAGTGLTDFCRFCTGGSAVENSHSDDCCMDFLTIDSLVYHHARIMSIDMLSVAGNIILGLCCKIKDHDTYFIL